MPLGEKRNEAARIALWGAMGYAVGMLLAHALFGDSEAAMPIWAWDWRQWRPLAAGLVVVLLWRNVVEPALNQRRSGKCNTSRKRRSASLRRLADVVVALLFAVIFETLVELTVNEIHNSLVPFFVYLVVGFVMAGGTTYWLVRGAQRRRLVWSGALGGALTQFVAVVAIPLMIAFGVLLLAANGKSLEPNTAKDLIDLELLLLAIPLLFGVLTGLFCGLAIRFRLATAGLAIALAMAVYTVIWRELLTLFPTFGPDEALGRVLVALFWPMLMGAAGWGLAVWICPGAERLLDGRRGTATRFRFVHIAAAYVLVVAAFLQSGDIQKLSTILDISPSEWTKTCVSPDGGGCTVEIPNKKLDDGKESLETGQDTFKAWDGTLSITNAHHLKAEAGIPKTQFECWRFDVPDGQTVKSVSEACKHSRPGFTIVGKPEEGTSPDGWSYQDRREVETNGSESRPAVAIRMKYWTNGRRFYVLSVSTRRDRIGAPEADRFFRSFDPAAKPAATGNSVAPGGAAASIRQTTATVAANDSDTYWITFAGRGYGQVRVHSYGSTFLYVRVFDRSGNPLVSGTDEHGDAVLRFNASYSGAYRIVVENKEQIANSYHIATN